MSHPVLHFYMPAKPKTLTGRVFKSAWFSKAAKKAHIHDDELCAAVKQAMLGQADDLGGGVFKKRLNDNMHRSIILAKAGKWWVFEYLFAKKDRDNIEDDELVQFRALAKNYAMLNDTQIGQLIDGNHLKEICYDS
jgi:hypothetical protein